MNTRLSLDVDAPEKVPAVLQAAADSFFESSSELSAAWQDDKAGKIWEDFAKIMDRAAKDCVAALVKRGLR